MKAAPLLIERLADLLHHVVRVDRNTVPTQSRPGQETHKAKGLGCCRVNDFPHIDVQFCTDNGDSFTKPMFTARNVFSSSLAISATDADETGTTCSIAAPYKACASSVQVFVMPPTTLGVLCVSKSGLPGSMRSGENARKKSTPTLRPVD